MTPGSVSAEIGSKRQVEELQVEAEVDDFKPLTPEEAQVLRRKIPPVSPWRVIAGQMLVGCLMALAVGAVAGKTLGLSVAYGALAVVVPAAVFARGMMGPLAARNPGAAMVYFFLWEAAKVVLTVAMLYAAPKVVPDLSWLAMLAGFVVTLKVIWVFVILMPKRLQVVE